MLSLTQGLYRPGKRGSGSACLWGSQRPLEELLGSSLPHFSLDVEMRPLQLHVWSKFNPKVSESCSGEEKLKQTWRSCDPWFLFTLRRKLLGNFNDVLDPPPHGLFLP